MSLNEERLAVAELLDAAGVKTYDHIPERVTPPAAILVPGSPYLEQGQTFCDYTMRLEVTLVSGTASNAATTKALDTLVEQAVVALGQDYDVDEVAQPFQLSANNALYLATRVNISTTIILNGGS